MRILAHATTLFGRMPTRVARFEARVAAFAESTHPRLLTARDEAALLEALRGFLAIRTSWTDAAVADVSAMVTSALLSRFLRARFPGEPALAGTLLKGLRELPSGEPAAALFDLSREARRAPELAKLLVDGEHATALARFPAFGAAFEAYLERWGFRGSGELLLTRPSFQEDPSHLLDLLASYVALEGASPREAFVTKERERETETATVAARLPLLERTAFRAILRATQRAIAFRERVRLAQSLLYARLRRIALALGERLVARGAVQRREDVFFLTHEELLLGARSELRERIARRREEHARWCEVEPPEVVKLRRGESWRPSTSTSTSGSTNESSWRGVAACGGVATGRAAVLRDAREARELKRGAVLVVRETDPGWAPALFLASGLVCERGGLLSHGAILAREFGIPAVIGVEQALTAIAPGALVTVDGDKGLVALGG